MNIDIDSPAVDAGVKALFGHHPERGGQEQRQAVFAVLSAAVPVLESTVLIGEVMYFDHGANSFLGEVIGILRPLRIAIDIDTAGVRAVGRRVRIAFLGDDLSGMEFRAVEYGRSYGEALYKIRERIRVELGR